MGLGLANARSGSSSLAQKVPKDEGSTLHAEASHDALLPLLESDSVIGRDEGGRV